VTNNSRQQGVCCYAGRRIYSQLYIAISLYPADGILSAFVVIFITSFSIGSGSGQDIIKYQHSSKPSTLYVTLNKHPVHIHAPMTLPPDSTLFLAHGKAHKTLKQSQPCQELKMPTHRPPTPADKYLSALTL
jgi:hypothetical protein